MDNLEIMKQALDDAIKAAGSQKALAELCDVLPPSITGWILRGRVPVDRVLQVEKGTGVSKHRLRPDIYPLETIEDQK
jgi:DNA-binding transcriptional regulator YdaS (Cro superfamily)